VGPSGSSSDPEASRGESATTTPPADAPSNHGADKVNSNGKNAAGAWIDPFDEQLVNEIRILIDFLSSNTNKSLASGSAGLLPTVGLGNDLTPGAQNYGGALQHYFEIARKLLGAKQSAALAELSAAERRFLSEFHDYLTEAAKPATSSTVAFSTLVGEFEKSRGGHIDEAAGLLSSIRVSFPRYQELARNFQSMITGFRWISLLLLLLIFVASAYVYSGSLYLGRLAESHSREAALDERLAKIEAGIDDQLPRPGSALTASAANTPAQNISISGDPYRLRQCILYKKGSETAGGTPHLVQHFASKGLLLLESGDQNLEPSGQTPRQAGSSLSDAPDADFVFNTDVAHARLCSLWEVAKGDTRTEQQQLRSLVQPLQFLLLTPRSGGVELSGAAVVALVAGYILPLLMGIVGSLVFVLRTYLTQLRDKTLNPRDKHIYLIRVLLGSIAGLAIGFFMHPGSASASTTSTEPWNVSISLTTPALAFLAGYAVEIVFALLDSMAQMLFVARK
jgi:hypothetical protein